MMKNPTSSNINENGGTAFPRAPMTGEWPVQYNGMTLRDYFAAKIAAAYASDAEWREDMDFASTARSAYKMADAMLKERCKA